jgi:hypothetical protein
MPEPAIYIGTAGRNLVTPTSRYYERYLLRYGEHKKLAFQIYRKKNLKFSPSDLYYEITKEAEFRPDLVSNQTYGVPDYWWKIMEMNGMKDILEFRAGRNIRLPGGNVMF